MIELSCFPRSACQQDNAVLFEGKNDADENVLWNFIESRRTDMWIGLKGYQNVGHTFEPRLEKTYFFICGNKSADQLCGYRAADQCICFCYIDSTIPLLPKSEISSLKPSSVTVQ